MIDTIVLCAEPLEERHSGEYISSKFDEMLNKWNISKDKVHCVMRESGANMRESLFLSGVNNFDYAAHKINLIVKRGIESKVEITDIITKYRTIARYFHNSAMAQSELIKIQERLGKQVLGVVHETQIRWN